METQKTDLQKAASMLGRLGGLAGRGACKARPATARKAALARWTKYNEGKASEQVKTDNNS
jgi:hypothetical protein